MSGRKPEIAISAWPVKAAVWKNERDGKVWHSITFSKVYRGENEDGDTVWKNTNNFSERDLPVLASLALKLHAQLGVQDD